MYRELFEKAFVPIIFPHITASVMLAPSFTTTI